ARAGWRQAWRAATTRGRRAGCGTATTPAWSAPAGPSRWRRRCASSRPASPPATAASTSPTARRPGRSAPPSPPPAWTWRGRGALLLPADWHSLLHSGALDPAGMIGLLRQAAGRARADGFAGLRVTTEMDGPPGGGAGRDRLLEYEALLNDALPGSVIVVACQYDRRRGDAAVLRDALRTHPLAVLGERACSNPFCEPPGVVLGGDEAGRVEWMLGRLRCGEEEAAERRRVEQSL